MSIFNIFDKKPKKQTQKKDIIRTAAVDKAFNPNRYEFDNIDNEGGDNNEIIDNIVESKNSNDVIENKNLDNNEILGNTEVVDDLKNNNIDLDILDDLPKIDEKFDLDLKTDFDKNIDNAEKINKDFDKFQESLSSDFDKILKDKKINNKLDNLLKDNLPKVKEVKKDTEIKLPIVEVKKDVIKTEEKEKTVSEIAFLAMSRPANVAFDLGDDVYVDEGCEVIKFDIYGTQTDLEKFVEEHLDIKYLDISDCREDLNFSVLSKLKKLKHLDLSGNRNLENISSKILYNVPVTSYSPIA